MGREPLGCPTDGDVAYERRRRRFHEITKLFEKPSRSRDSAHAILAFLESRHSRSDANRVFKAAQSIDQPDALRVRSCPHSALSNSVYLVERFHPALGHNRGEPIVDEIDTVF